MEVFLYCVLNTECPLSEDPLYIHKKYNHPGYIDGKVSATFDEFVARKDNVIV